MEEYDFKMRSQVYFSCAIFSVEYMFSLLKITKAALIN